MKNSTLILQMEQGKHCPCKHILKDTESSGDSHHLVQISPLPYCEDWATYKLLHFQSCKGHLGVQRSPGDTDRQARIHQSRWVWTQFFHTQK
ncbi:hypothetical protein LEMLEM_LOCUS9605 [Lemmus lemmus]